MYRFCNANPLSLRVGDCVIRAIAVATEQTWEKVYMDLALLGFTRADLPSANAVWGAYLKSLGYTRHLIPDTCPDCYTVRQFCEDNPKGTFILALNGHVVAVRDGIWMDTWDSGDETPIYYWRRESNVS